MSKEQTALEKLARLLENTHKQVNIILVEPELATIKLSVTHDLEKLANKINFLAGTQVTLNKAEDFPPVTSFMGEPIKPVKEVKKEDLTPDEHEKATFIARVEKLYAEFPSLAPEGILNSYTLPEDQAVVRGVAKRAGMTDFNDATLSISYLEKIAKAMKQKEADAAEEKRIEAELANQKKIVELEQKLKDVETKLPQLLADHAEALEEQKAATDEKSKKKLGAKVKAIEEEITAAGELQTKLTEDLNALQAS